MKYQNQQIEHERFMAQKSDMIKDLIRKKEEAETKFVVVAGDHYDHYDQQHFHFPANKVGECLLQAPYRGRVGSIGRGSRWSSSGWKYHTMILPWTTRAPAVLTNTKPPNLQWVVPNGKAPMAPKAHGGGEEEIGMLTRYFFFSSSAI